MKRGTPKTLTISLIILLSLTFVSAGIFGDLFNAMTGRATTTTTDPCEDSDGGLNYVLQGTVNYFDEEFVDYCADNATLIEYYCYTDETIPDDPAGGIIDSFLSLINLKEPTITGNAIQTGENYNSEEYDCSVDGKSCTSGQCGCTPGDVVSCGESAEYDGIGICNLGEQTCQLDGTWGECVGDQGPITETCNGLDDDCNDETDEDTCQEGYECREEYGYYGCYAVTYSCNDEDNDGYGDPGNDECSKGSQTDCNDHDNTIYPGADEDCGYPTNPTKIGYVDEDCDGKSDDNDEDAHQDCKDRLLDETATCMAELMNANDVEYGEEPEYHYTCNVPLQPQCIDNDDDGYGNPGNAECSNGPQEDCDDSNPDIKPGETEICDDGVDNDCNGDTDCADSACADESICENCPKDADCSGLVCGADPVCGQSCGTCDEGYICDQGSCIIDCESEIYDSDNDGFISDEATECETGGISLDCNDDNADANPSVDEVCDGIDNDCDGEVDNINEVIDCQANNDSQNNGNCLGHKVSCTAGFELQTCEDLGLNSPGSEIANDGIDNNCEDGVDEGTVCSPEGKTKSCTPSQTCKKGEQTCTNGQWSSCVATENIENCNVNTVCVSGDVDICGTNIGICSQGYKECSDGEWGDCLESVKPKDNEICYNNLDDNCDGRTDETSCIIVAPSGSSGGGSSSSSSSGSSSGGFQGDFGSSSSGGVGSESQKGSTQNSIYIQEQDGFFTRLFKFFVNLFYVGRNMVGFSVSEAPLEPECSDSDGGKNYFTKGTGTGLSNTDKESIFGDFCYEDVQSNQQEKCGGENCFLKEYFCQEGYIKSEPKVVCEYGCLNGACIPDASLNDDCYYFDRNQWKWVNNC